MNNGPGEGAQTKTGFSSLRLADTRLGQLDKFLRSGRAPDGMELSALDGFLTGLVIGPAVILPGEWLPVIWGCRTPAFAGPAEAETMQGIILERYIEIAAQLDRGPQGLEPVFWIASHEKTVFADNWAKGFLDAMNLRAEAWTPLIADERAGIFLAPILALCVDGHGKPLLSIGKEEVDQWHVHAPDMIPASVLAIRDFWREQDFKETLMQPVQ